MNPGLRVLISFVILLFLIFGGLLGGLQDIQQSMVEDPQQAAEIADGILPMQAVANAKAYKAIALEKENYYAAWLRDREDETAVFVILGSLPVDKYQPQKGMHKGLRFDWKPGDYREEQLQKISFRWRDQEAPGELLVYRRPDGATRNQFVIAFELAGQVIQVLANGSAEVVTRTSFQAMLDSVPADFNGRSAEASAAEADPNSAAPDSDATSSYATPDAG